MVQGILITSVHLQYQAGEVGRIVQIRRVWDELRKKGVWTGMKHIFAGDFNSLTWEDKSADEWERVAEEIREKKFVEDPKFDLTRLMKKHGFTDCWLDVGKWEGRLGSLGQIGEGATCR